MQQHRVYKDALDADQAFHEALVEAYGENHASVMRYRTNELTPELQLLSAAKSKADMEWWKVLRCGEINQQTGS